MAKQKIVTLGKNPKLSELVAWAEQNGFRVEFELRDKQSAQHGLAQSTAGARRQKSKSSPHRLRE
jgi:hypothetical protein